MAYKTKYSPHNLSKYVGNPNDCVCRSLWERALAKHLDLHPNVKRWGMEGVVIPYWDKSSGKRRRYYVDFFIEFASGATYIVEVKPSGQTKPPVQRKRTRRYLLEVATYGTNISKWEAAKQYAAQRGWKFEVWTEETLKKIGLKVI